MQDFITGNMYVYLEQKKYIGYTETILKVRYDKEKLNYNPIQNLERQPKRYHM